MRCPFCNSFINFVATTLLHRYSVNLKNSPNPLGMDQPLWFFKILPIQPSFPYSYGQESSGSVDMLIVCRCFPKLCPSSGHFGQLHFRSLSFDSLHHSADRQHHREHYHIDHVHQITNDRRPAFPNMFFLHIIGPSSSAHCSLPSAVSCPFIHSLIWLAGCCLLDSNGRAAAAVRVPLH